MNRWQRALEWAQRAEDLLTQNASVVAEADRALSGSGFSAEVRRVRQDAATKHQQRTLTRADRRIQAEADRARRAQKMLLG